MPAPPPPSQTAMPYVTMTLKYRFKRTCLSKNRHFLMRLNLFAKFFFSSLTCEVRQRPTVCYNGPNLGSTLRGKRERGDQWTILCGQAHIPTFSSEVYQRQAIFLQFFFIHTVVFLKWLDSTMPGSRMSIHSEPEKKQTKKTDTGWHINNYPRLDWLLWIFANFEIAALAMKSIQARLQLLQVMSALDSV